MPSPFRLLLAVALLLTAPALYSQPVNDECSGATFLSVGANPVCDDFTAGTTVGAGYSGVDACGLPYPDVWYMFIATAGAHTVSVSNAVDAFGNPVYFQLEFFSGNCAGLVHSFCSSWYYQESSLAFGDFVPGDTCYIRVTNPYSQAFNFNICVGTAPPPPANDACAGAIALSPGPDAQCDAPVSGSTEGATASGTPGCNSCSAYYDVWYTFTATQANHNLRLENIRNATNPYSAEQAHVNVFSGDCGNLSSEAFFSYYDNGTYTLNNLTAGTVYFVRVYAVGLPYPITFDLCVTSPPPPPNDECAGAEPVSASPDLYCFNYFNGSLMLATASGTNCQGEATNDVWYQFTATSHAHYLFVNPDYGPVDFGFEVYGGGCDSLYSLKCVTYPQTSALLSGLTPGETYFFRVFALPNTYLGFGGCLLTLPPPPANDDCASAEPVPVNTELNCNLQISGTTLGATSDVLNCTGNKTTYDVWYSFVAGAGAHRVEINPTTSIIGSSFQMGYEIFSGNCTGLQSITCKSFYSNYEPAILENLTQGETYYIRVYSDYNSAHGFSICIQELPPPPANTSCTSATALTPSPVSTCATSTAGTTAGIVGATTGTCYYGVGMDVWYSFVATNTTHILRISDVQALYGSYEYWVEIYTSVDGCDSLVFKNCIVYLNTLYMSDLVAGNTYYVRWSSAPGSAHNFNICIGSLPAPSNDVCAGAIDLPVDTDLVCDTYVSGTTGGSSSDGTNACFSNGDVWYKFTATQSAHSISFSNIVEIENNGPQPLSIEVLAGGCGNFSPLYCLTGPVYNNGTVSIGDLVQGETYYLRIAAFYETPVNFDICLLTPPPPPANDACFNAVPLVPEIAMACTNPVAGTNLNATTSPGAPFLCCGNGDVWYSFTATQAIHVLTLSEIVGANTGFTESATIQIYATGCDSLGGAFYERSFYSIGSAILTTLTPGQTYLVRVFNYYYSSPANFNICLAAPPPPANDECANAAPLPINEDLSCNTTLTVSTLGATQSQPACGGGVANDLWYQFVAEESSYRIDIDILSGEYNLWGFEIFSGTCDNLQSIYCGQAYYTLPLIQGGFTPGETYFLRFFSNENNIHQLKICTRAIPAPPANDECAGASVLSPDADLVCDAPSLGTTAGATQSLTSCYGAASHDVWYTFIATGQSHMLHLQTTATYFGDYANMGVQVFSGDCNQLVSLYCSDYLAQNDQVLHNLTPGQVYTVRVFSPNNYAHDFEICLMTLPPPPANDICQYATAVVPNEGLTCDIVTPGTTIGATFDQQYYSPDVWYSFTATSNSHIIELLNVNTLLGNPGNLAYWVFQGSDCDSLVFLANFYAGNTAFLNYLQPGETYYVRVVSNDPNAAYGFDLCIKSMPPSPPNEECTGAYVLMPNTGLDCEVVLAGSTAGAVTIVNQTCGYGNDVWYQFVATSPNHWVQATNITPVFGTGTLWIEVLQSEDCQNFTSLYCTYFDQIIYLSGLVTGATYYVRAVSEYGTAHAYNLCVRTIQPPANDLCANAAMLDVSPETSCTATVSGTTTGSGPSPGVSNCGLDGNDVWYSFVATQSSHTIAVSNVMELTGNYPFYIGVEVYAGSCENLNSLLCYPNLYSSGQITIGELVSGALYYIRLSSYALSVGFDICVGTPPPPPPNDACVDAENIPVHAGEVCETPTQGTLQYATPGNTPLHFGYNQFDIDVWYSFEALQPNHLITVNGTPGSSLIIEVYTGTCGSLTIIGQKNLYFSNHLLLTNLSPGSIYYVRMLDAGNQPSGFDICITSIPAPPNDECAGAINLPVSPGLTCIQMTEQSSYGATQSLPDCNGFPVNDIWFSFVASSVSHRLLLFPSGVDGNNSYVGLEILEGSCNNLTPVIPCSEYYSGGPYSQLLQNLTPGNTYYVRLLSSRNDYKVFNICVQTLPNPPANDGCAEAILINANTDLNCDTIYTGTTLGATQSAQTCNGNASHDVWYRFVATGTSQLIEFTITDNWLWPSYGYLGVATYSGDDCGNLAPLQCYDYTPYPSFTMSGLTVGNTYFIRAFSSYGSAHDFSLCIKTLPPPPPNDNCVAAQTLTPAEGLECTNPVAGTTGGVLTNESYSCQYGPDVWYQFTATSNIHLIRLQNLVNVFGSNALSLELFGGTDCNSLFALACSFGAPEIYATNLQVGANYFIRVVGAQNSGVNFDICVLTVLPPVNDECAGALPLPVSSGSGCDSTLQGTTIGSTQSSGPGCSVGADVWYSFVATTTDHSVRLSNVTGGNSNELVYEVFSGNCSSLSSMGCFSAYSLANFANLIPGETYYVRIGSYSAAIFEYDLCVTPSLPDLVPVYLAPNSNGCGAGNNETVQAVFYNQSAIAIPPGATTFTLEVQGDNSGTYGPLTNTYAIPPGLYAYVEFTGVDLSNPGVSVLTVTGTTVGDDNTDNDHTSISFNVWPLDTFYYDVDRDGYGDANYFIVSCFQYEGYSSNNTDCNDYDASIHPGASEFCNGYDDDCDGLTDGDDPGVVDTLPPTVSCPADVLTDNDSGLCSAIVDYGTVNASDDCSYTLEQTTGLASGEAFPVGLTTNTFVATDAGGNAVSCSFTVEVLKSADPDLLYAYTVIGFKEVQLRKNTVASGGVGVTNANKKAILQSGTTVTAANTFVKAPDLQLQGGSQATTWYQGQTDAALLPAFQPNNSPGNNNVNIANNSAPVTLGLASYGKITVGNNVTVTFSGHALVRIKELQVGNDATLLFAQGTELLIDKKMDIGKRSDINPGGGQSVQFFAEGEVSIDRGCDVNANIYTQKTLDVLQATAAEPTLMTGLFIADKVNAKDFVTWNTDASYCPLETGSRAPAGTESVEQPAVVARPGQLALSPNPASGEVYLVMDWPLEATLTITLHDATGRLIRTEKTAATERYRLGLQGLPEGIYTVQVTDGLRRETGKLVIVR